MVDTNVIAYLYLPGEHTAAAEALLQQDDDWEAPALWRSEFRNILAGFIRRRALTFDDALAVQAEAEHFMNGHEHGVDSRSVLDLVRASECSAYDCEFVALASALGVPLVTMDRALLKAFPGQTRALVGRAV
ncbi:MAG: type II toxin-antitoxin system VapC family toxin [Vicinamibacterales bacterium]